MEQELENALRIKYFKLHFTIALLENTKLPVDKLSALRGGMGEMLLRANCIRDRNCEKCDFEPECIVHKTLYTQYAARPKFVTARDSIGYILECENYDEDFSKGNLLQFDLILFGKTIVYFHQYIEAFRALGKEGIGKNHSKFQIVSVTDTRRKPFLEGDFRNRKQYPLYTLGEYAKYRVNQIQKNGCTNRLIFQTPLTLKYQNEFCKVFQMKAIWEAVQRRINMLECYEGMECSIYDCGRSEDQEMPVIREQVCRDVFVSRFSSTQNKKMTLWGVKGYMQLDYIPEDMLFILTAGELTHIGKNTSFGFGKYRIT